MLLRQKPQQAPRAARAAAAPAGDDDHVVRPQQAPQAARAAAAAAAAAAGAGGDDNVARLFSRRLEGKTFMCTECGKCCSGPGEVWMSSSEARRIAQHLQLPWERFLDDYCIGGREGSGRRFAGWHQLVSKPGSPDNACVFLDGQLCSIHAVRPGQCSQYPWWPELMDAQSWEAEKTICEGLDHADAPPLDTAHAARTLREATQQLQLRLLSRRLTPEG